MKVLLGEFNKGPCEQHLEPNGFGRMWASKHPAWSYEGEPWGFDNGAWSAFTAGEKFDGGEFLKRLRVAKLRCTYAPLVAAVPDVVGEGLASLALSQEWLESGLFLDVSGFFPQPWNWHLVVQDGVCVERVRRMLGMYPTLTGIFLGGTNEFKRKSAYWCAMAHHHGKTFHFGRCNRDTWLRDAIRIGADSIDTSTPIRQLTTGNGDWFRKFVRDVTTGSPQQELPLWS